MISGTSTVFFTPFYNQENDFGLGWLDDPDPSSAVLGNGAHIKHTAGDPTGSVKFGTSPALLTGTPNTVEVAISVRWDTEILFGGTVLNPQEFRNYVVKFFVNGVEEYSFQNPNFPNGDPMDCVWTVGWYGWQYGRANEQYPIMANIDVAVV